MLTNNAMSLLNKKIIVYNIESGERFEYALPFQYKGITYALDIRSNIVAIEQEFKSGEWRCENVYQLSDDQQLFKITFEEFNHINDKN